MIPTGLLTGSVESGLRIRQPALLQMLASEVGPELQNQAGRRRGRYEGQCFAVVRVRLRGMSGLFFNERKTVPIGELQLGGFGGDLHPQQMPGFGQRVAFAECGGEVNTVSEARRGAIQGTAKPRLRLGKTSVIKVAFPFHSMGRVARRWQ